MSLKRDIINAFLLAKKTAQTPINAEAGPGLPSFNPAVERAASSIAAPFKPAFKALDRQIFGEEAQAAPIPEPLEPADVPPPVGMGDVKQADRAFDMRQEPAAPKPAPKAARSKPSPEPDYEDTRGGVFSPRKYGYGDELNDDAIKAAQEQAAQTRKGNMVFEGFSDMGRALSGTKRDDKFLERLDAQADQPLKDIATRRKGLSEEQTYAQGQEEADPGSAVNVGFRSMLSDFSPKLAKLPGFGTLTVKTGGPLQKMADLYLQRQMQRDNGDIKRLMMMRENEDRQGRFDDKMISEYASKLERAGIPETSKLVADLEQTYGKPIEEITEQELEGFGRFTNAVPDWAYMGGDKGERTRTTVQALVNELRHGKFGAQLSHHERGEFLKQSGTGIGTPGRRTLGFLKQLKGATNSRLKNLEAGLPDRLKGEAARRGITTSPSGGAGPRPGDSEGGYRFKGGDPGDPNNWEQE